MLQIVLHLSCSMDEVLLLICNSSCFKEYPDTSIHGVVMISSSLNWFKKSYDFLICDINKKYQKIMAPWSDNHGVSAIVLDLLRILHPSKHIRNKFSNVVQGQWLENCVTICQEVKKVSWKDNLSWVTIMRISKIPMTVTLSYMVRNDTGK